MIVKTKINKKTTFTRMCIAEAILELLDTIDFEKLKNININEDRLSIEPGFPG